MKNTFTYFPHERIYHIHLGVNGQLGYTIADQEGFDIASSYKGTWSAKDGYARIKERYKAIYLARLVINAPEFYDVDHINGVTFDNRKCNLQLVTEGQNMAKSKLASNNASGYRGVSWLKANKKWEAYITVEGKRLNLGLHLTKEEAALAYNKAAKFHFKEFAFQNVIK